jgi:hypothetical protein
VISRFQLSNFDRGVWLWRRLDRWLPWSPTSIIAIGRKPGEPTQDRQTNFERHGAKTSHVN